MQFLGCRTWREIRLTSLAHGIKFNANFTRQEGFDTLHQSLIAQG